MSKPSDARITLERFKAMQVALGDYVYEGQPFAREIAIEISETLHRVWVTDMEARAQQGRKKRIPESDLRIAYIANWLMSVWGATPIEAMEAVTGKPIPPSSRSKVARTLRNRLRHVTDRHFPGFDLIYAAKRRLPKKEKSVI